MKLNYEYSEGKTDYKKGDYGRCDYQKCSCHEQKKQDYEDYEKCCDEHKYAKCCPKSPCPYPIIFECSQGTGTDIERTIPNGLSDASVNYFHPRSLGCLTIDTSCLKMPVVKFDFSSIIKFRSAGNEDRPVRLTFQLFKQCENGPEVSCGTWDYVAALDVNDERVTTSFCFSHCECNACPGCCTYSVKITEAFNVRGESIVTVYSPTLSAIAKSSC